MASSKKELDTIVLNIEFLLISVVQGVALGALANSAIGPITNFQFEYWPYVATAFIFILTFWSGAVIHSLSFIDWPLDLAHNFLYFLASFIEVLAFGQMMNPVKWFEFVFAFFLVAGILYIVDLRLIRRHKNDMSTDPQQKKLYNHIKKQHLFELFVLVPAGLVYNVIALALIRLYPETFLDSHQHVFLISIQLLFGLIVLGNAMQSYRRRAKLIFDSGG